MHIIDSDAGAGAGAGAGARHHAHALSTATPKEQPHETSPAPQQQEASQQHLKQIWAWNQHVPPNLASCMHDLIANVSSSQPSLLAVDSHDGTFTYGELEQLSTRLAHHLVASGVTIGTRIPLCFEKSKWAVVALLGVVKSGATFTLTDPSQPEARLRTIVEQAGARIVVTSESQQGLGRRMNPSGEVVTVSRDFLASIAEPVNKTLPVVPPSSPMYVIFTSGSTGKPKGVVISHENYTSGAVPRAAAVGYHPGSRVFDFPSYAFDVSIDCMLCTLSVGGCICIPSEEKRMNDLSGAIRLSKANMVHMTPSVARVLDEDIIPSLEVLGLGGEAVGARDAQNWGQKTRLIIAYGPSECTVGCTINNEVHVSSGIGKGVGGVSWIVDPEDHSRLTPVGEVGELLVEGPLVGIGYLDEPAKTAEVFIEDPAWLTAGFGSVAGRTGRLYKTGDLVRYEPIGSGSVEFVGRKDQQVKLRGQRVELAEVEHHVRDCLPSGVRVAAEVIKPENGAPTLIAFLSEPNSTQEAATEWLAEPSAELKQALASAEEALASRVPRYMVPAAFVSLREMPSLVSGKVDRKKLREIGLSVPRDTLASRSDAAAALEDPVTDFEKRLAHAWIQVLGAERKIYRRSNFFQLGGDSLRAMRLVSAAREQAIQLTVGQVFTHPTLSGMAGSAAATGGELAHSDVAPFSLLPPAWDVESVKRQGARLCSIGPEEVGDMYPCTPLQEALMALSAKIKDAYVAQRVVKLDSVAQAERLVAAFRAVSADCAILRTRIVQVPGRGLVQVVLREEFPYKAEDDLDSYLESDREEPMELGTPLVRYALVRDATSGAVNFILTIHHALYDGWSMPLIISRVNAAYLSEPVSSPVPFNHFIHYLDLQDREESVRFWQDRLHGASGPQFPALPHAGYQTNADSLQEIYVPLPSTTSLSVTAATVIRAAWALVASQYINSDDIVFGETLTGRNAALAGVEGIEGPMITTIPFRVSLSRDLSISDYLQQVQDQTVAQIPHEHFGLQHIRRLSADAFEACELRTGLVLHPSSEGEEEIDSSLPANRLVPAGDEEAAREALKFNTYALMLVCSIDPKGFLVMASWDSRCLDAATLDRVLDQFKLVVQRLCEGGGFVGDVELLAEGDVEALKQWRGSTSDLAYEGIQGVHVVDSRDSQRLLPLGAIGDLIIRSTAELSLPVLEDVSWLHRLYEQPPGGKLYRTRELASLTPTSVILHKPHAPVVSTPAAAAKQTGNPGPTASGKQRLLRSLWSRVLSKPESDISPSDSFFVLGGDSISAMKLVSEARGESLVLTVTDIFRHKTLGQMTDAMAFASPEDKAKNRPVEAAAPYSLLPHPERTAIAKTARASLANPDWQIENIVPARPLQAIAVDGTVNTPRFSARYELLTFETAVDLPRIRTACQSLVSQVEILRTVFVCHEATYYSVILSDLQADFVEYQVDSDVATFCNQLARLDVQTRMPLGSSFVKWFFVSNASSTAESCLVMRISHAQYDELALPLVLKHLSSLYTSSPVSSPSIPFSSFVSHSLTTALPASLAYWTSLLAGSQMSVLRPDPAVPVADSAHYAISQTLSVATRPDDITIATLPTAAWALVLARRLSRNDILFGHVVSGRASATFTDGDRVVGPCWSYIPLRVILQQDWTVAKLLSAVQAQLVTSAPHASAALSEITPHVPSLRGVDWFDTVVHQDVQHVHGSGYAESMRSMGVTRQDTVYPHEEPLREWKVQAFIRGEEMEMEIVTVKSWEAMAAEVLDDVVAAVKELVGDQGKRLF